MDAESTVKEPNVIWVPHWADEPEYRDRVEFVCDFCGKTFNKLSDFTQHSRFHNVKVGVQGNIRQKKIRYNELHVFWLDAWAKYPNNVEYYECSLCYERFMTLRGLSEHCLRLHNVKVRVARDDGTYTKISHRKSGMNKSAAIFRGGLPGLGKRR